MAISQFYIFILQTFDEFKWLASYILHILFKFLAHTVNHVTKMSMIWPIMPQFPTFFLDFFFPAIQLLEGGMGDKFRGYEMEHGKGQ